MAERNGWSGSPGVPLISDGKERQKRSHDRYEVYVNGKFMGHKVLSSESESPQDVETYLVSMGIHCFTLRVEGDRIRIRTEGKLHEKSVRDHIAAHLKNR
ncbi:hypothetical protein C8P63_12140 [Melghirimyces profundicolus]|uniref:Uncharacterized protein n=1 Tax=Melghirimyces profundicolus TaxID=1242148 RepID=A0A2T6BGI1_9BACL|nr:hypothetical protein [Melghirimyces profundicolus]PTX55160.1 hypothetical protein C8P63_12140 [Melghirimyces profundicolus]